MGKGKGLLVKGTPLPWEDSLKHLKYVREHGVAQFLATFKRVKDIRNDKLLWGEEVEYMIVRLDHEAKTTKISLRAKELEDELNAKEEDFLAAGGRPTDGCNWLPEYGSWMIEATPRVPYTGFTQDLCRVEVNLRLRRARLLAALQGDEIAPTICAFPMMGVGDFTCPSYAPNGPIAESRWVPDECTNPHPRFGTLTQNIRKRRGEKVDIRVPIFIDKNTFSNSKRRKEMVNAIGHANEKQIAGLSDKARGTPDGAEEGGGAGAAGAASSSSSGGGGGSSGSGGSSSASSPKKRKRALSMAGEDTNERGFDLFLSADDEIVMDCMAYGMGCCCLQVTFQARDMDESRRLFDLLAPLAPVMLALTAATPIFKGQLANTDVRWDVIGKSVDCRTPQERGMHCPKMADHPKPEMAGGGTRRLHKSRYASVSNYIWRGNTAGGDGGGGGGAAAAAAKGATWHDVENPLRHDVEKYNDIDAPRDEEAYKTLTESGVDHLLAQHLAHLFVRDPLVIYSERIELDDEKEKDHFENIQSTNWQTLRWKPPPPSDGTEDSPHVGWRTEFRSMEIQLTDFENAAFSVFVVLASRVILAFDLNTYVPLSMVDENMATAHRRDAASTERFWFRRHLVTPEGGVPAYEDVAEKMTIQQILMGKGSYFPGLIPMIFAYLDSRGCDSETRATVENYLRFIRMRATGEVMTTAAWIRKFVREHEDYQQDSVVTQRISYDLLRACHDIGAGLRAAPELVGSHVAFRPVAATKPYMSHLSGETVSTSERDRLIKMYMGRSSFHKE